MKKELTQVPRSHYFNLKYDTKERWISYWYQIHEVFSLNPKKILEVGIGNKLVSDYIRKIGLNITTCDFDKSLKPDYVGSVHSLPFKNDSFDVILCAEVLEHLPFKNFNQGLKELYRVSKKFVILTLPHFSLTNFYFGFKLIPFVPKKQISIKVDAPIKHKFLGEHFWEIGKKDYSTSRVRSKIKRSGFKIEKDYCPPENPKHHFFVLTK